MGVLRAAGLVELRISGEGVEAVCSTDSSLCGPSTSNGLPIKSGLMSASLPPQRLSDLPGLPTIRNASLALASDGRSATLSLSGSGFGGYRKHVVAVAVAGHACQLTTHSNDSLMANCSTARSGWVRGLPTVTTLAGRGQGCAEVAGFLLGRREREDADLFGGSGTGAGAPCLSSSDSMSPPPALMPPLPELSDAEGSGRRLVDDSSPTSNVTEWLELSLHDVRPPQPTPPPPCAAAAAPPRPRRALLSPHQPVAM